MKNLKTMLLGKHAIPSLTTAPTLIIVFNKSEIASVT